MSLYNIIPTDKIEKFINENKCKGGLHFQGKIRTGKSFLSKTVIAWYKSGLIV